MSGSAQGWLLLLIGFVAANLPFFTERLLLVGPRRAPKPLGWRLLELLLLSGLPSRWAWQSKRASASVHRRAGSSTPQRSV